MRQLSCRVKWNINYLGMKQCPTCRTTYTDPTLRYCLADGAVLIDAPEQPTWESDNTVTAGAQETVRMYTPNTDPTVVRQAPQRKGVLGKVLLALAALGMIVVVGAAFAAFLLLRPSPDQTPNANQTILVKPADTPSYDSDEDETEKLKEQIANLERLLNEQKRSDKPSTIPLSLPDQESTVTSARVNSPGDGFLALRTYPNSQAGAKILEIPHGATISVGACLNRSKVAKRGGRWCRANYDGYSGWVFDAYLIY